MFFLIVLGTILGISMIVLALVNCKSQRHTMLLAVNKAYASAPNSPDRDTLLTLRKKLEENSMTNEYISTLQPSLLAMLDNALFDIRTVGRRYG